MSAPVIDFYILISDPLLQAKDDARNVVAGVGIDYPVDGCDPFATLKKCAILSDADRAMIARETLAKILGLA